MRPRVRPPERAPVLGLLRGARPAAVAGFVVPGRIGPAVEFKALRPLAAEVDDEWATAKRLAAILVALDAVERGKS